MELWQLVIAAATSAFGVHWWQQVRLRRECAWAIEQFDEAAQVMFHVARHEAETRHQRMSSIHLLYGLLQDEAIVAALARAGCAVDALEDRVLAVIAANEPVAYNDGVAAMMVAAARGRAHGRPPGCSDVWASLDHCVAASLLDDHGVDRARVLFALAHPTGEAPLELPGVSDVFIVLRNDDFTTFEFVVRVLCEQFGCTEADAQAVARKVHVEGRGVVARASQDDARAKILRARKLAREQRYPLWIGIEPT
ncbi:MAG: ATP-dependent Clp protease adaptor ClpS [Kofleriaceae bacterium]